MIKVRHILLAIAMMPITSWGADNVPDASRTVSERVTEPSPEVMQMRRFADYDVDYAAGSTSLSIPLMEVSTATLKVPLSLHYRCEAKKVEEAAGYLGLGWAMTGLGSVSRQICGQPDDKTTNYLEIKSTESQLSNEYFSDLFNFSKDADYDRYTIVTPSGESATFIITANGLKMLAPTELKVWYESTSNNFRPESFKAKSSDGTYYEFCKKEEIEYTYNPTSIAPDFISPNYTAVTAWHLTKICNPARTDSIMIEYTAGGTWKRKHGSVYLRSMAYHHHFNAENSYITGDEGEEEDPEPGGPWVTPIDGPINGDKDLTKERLSDTGASTTYISPPLPKTITWNRGKITFSFVDDTGSMSDECNGTANRLESLTMTDPQGQLVRQIIFTSGAFGDGRRNLKSVSIKGESEVLEAYSFIYKSRAKSDSKDFFGYPNGNITDLKRHSVLSTARLKLSKSRYSDATSITDGMLTSVKSSAGLETTFEYEPSKITNTDTLSIFGPEVTVGVRLKKISVRDLKNGRTRTREFSYSQPVMTVDATFLRPNAFLGSSGVKTLDLAIIPLYIICDMSVTFTGSSRLPGMPAESGRILYGRVEENVSGTDIASPVRTVYEYDLSECLSTSRPIGNGRLIPPMYIKEDPDLLYFDTFYSKQTGREWIYRKVFGLNTIRSYFSEALGGEPMLKKKTTYRKEGSVYKADVTQTYSYEVCDRSETVVGFYHEFMAFKNDRKDGALTMIIDWENNVDFGWVKTESKRIILTGSKTTRHYSNGHDRTIATDYIYEPKYREVPRIPDSLLLRNSKILEWGYHPGFDIPLTAITDYTRPFRPFGVTYSHSGDTITRYDLYSSQREPSGFDASKDPLYLPVAAKWVSVIEGRSDTILDETDYARFHGALLPTSQVISRKGAIIDKAEYSAYQNPGLLTSMTDRNGRTISLTWDSYGYLTGKTVSGISGTTSYTNQALVGCTSVTLPSGKKRSFGYDNGRLSWERNTSDELVASYSYSLALKNPGAILIGKPKGENAITITRSTGSSESTIKSVYDGFGLKIKDIAGSFGGDGGDVVTQTDYDGLDRPLRVWRPYPATSKASTYYGDTHPYSAAEYADNGSDFVVRATAPGQRMQGHSTQNDRLCNTDAGQLAVRRYIVADGQLTFSGNYLAGSLEAVKTIDPDGHTAIVFSDWRGRTVLTRRVLSDGDYADTYTVYDHWGNPLVVLPPLASNCFASKGQKYTLTGTPASDVNNHLYIYGYDDALRQISSKAPGVDAVTTSYDPNGLVAFSTDGNLRKDGRARFTLYDSAARPVVTGICDAPSATEPVPSMLATVGGTGIDNTGYSAAYARLQNPTVLTAAYYDFNTPPASSELTGLTSGFHKKASLVNSTLERVMNTDRFITTVYDYDAEERVIGQASTTHTAGVTQVVSNSYNIDGSVAASETKLMHPTGNHSDKRTFGYDSQGRLTAIRHSLDGGAEVTLWSGTYNAVGQLATVANGVFTESLVYDVDGTLKSRTSDVFSQQISREGLYNGSISGITDMLEGKQSTATYTYDALDRLTGADIMIGGRDRSTTYTYDLNGNITSLTRMGDDGVDTGRLIDDLSLSYSGNQLTKVTEFADPVFSEATMNFAKRSTVRPHYRYDSNGNLITAPDKSASYRWDVNNRLLEVSFAENNTYVRFTRSASGAKLGEKSRKPVVDGGSQISKTRHYYGPFEYLGNSLARVNVPGGYMDDSSKFHAYATDWQGNVRAVVSKQGSGVVVEQATWYYPYGMPTCDSRSAAVNRYKYTGKELITDNATNLYDYPARLYDPVLGRWLSVDELTHPNAPTSHYAMCASDPINHIDSDGRDTINISNIEGKWLISEPILAEGNDVLNVVNRNEQTQFTFSEGEYGKRVCMLNIEIGSSKKDATFGVYHISGSKENGTGYYFTRGGNPSTAVGSNARIPDGEYPITSPLGVEEWRKPGVGGSVVSRGIRFHYGTNHMWSKGCFVLGYSINSENKFNIEDSKQASRNFDKLLGADYHFEYIAPKCKKHREGSHFNQGIIYILILKSTNEGH